MFPIEYINEGHVAVLGKTVNVYSDMYHARALCNVPGGNIKSANWQGNNIHVEMEDGWHYIYEDFGNYASRWR